MEGFPAFQAKKWGFNFRVCSMASASSRGLRILCLHGKGQNAKTFRTRMGRIPHKCRKVSEIWRFLDGPFRLPPRASAAAEDLRATNANDNEDTQQLEDIQQQLAAAAATDERAWILKEGDEIDVESVTQGLNFLSEFWTAEGGFDGVFGFSQGGSVAALMALVAAQRPHLFPGLRFCVCVAAPDILPAVSSSPNWSDCFLRQATLPTLHFAGAADQIVPVASSLALASRFVGATVIRHEQGHCVCTKPAEMQHIVQFLEHQQQADSSVGGSSS